MSAIDLEKVQKRKLTAVTVRIDKQSSLEMLEAIRAAVGLRATHVQVIDAIIERQFKQLRTVGKL